MVSPSEIERFRIRLEGQRTDREQQIAELERRIAHLSIVTCSICDDGEMGNKEKVSLFWYTLAPSVEATC